MPPGDIAEPGQTHLKPTGCLALGVAGRTQLLGGGLGEWPQGRQGTCLADLHGEHTSCFEMLQINKNVKTP